MEGQLKAFAHSVGGNTEDMSADHFIQASVNQMSQGMVQPETILFAVVFLLMFVICGYLLIYNIFDISVMQNVREYGLRASSAPPRRRSKASSDVRQYGLPLSVCRSDWPQATLRAG